MRLTLLVVLVSCALWGAANPVKPAAEPPPAGPYFPARYTTGDEWGRQFDLSFQAKLLKSLGEPSVFASETPTIRFLYFSEMPREGICTRLTRHEVTQKTYQRDLVAESTTHAVSPDRFDRALELVRRSTFRDGRTFMVGIQADAPLCLVEVRTDQGYQVGVGSCDTENGMLPLRNFLEGL